MSGINITELDKVYDSGTENVVAVENLSVEINHGEFLVLVGPSGCGNRQRSAVSPVSRT